MKRIITSNFLRLTVLTFLLTSVNIGFQIYGQDESQLVIIKGTIGGDNKGFNNVVCYGDGVPSSEQKMKNGAFEFKFHFERPIYALLFTEYDYEVKHGYKPSGVLIDKPGTVEIAIENIDNGFESATVAGLPSAVLYQSVRMNKMDIYKQISELTKKQYGKSSVPGEDPEFEKIERCRDSLENILLYPFLLEFISHHKDSYVGVFALNECKESIDLKETIKNYDAFSTDLKNSIHGKYIADYIEGAQNSQIGSFAKTFTLQTNEDVTFNFDQLKGKYIVLDFWASWCKPCRESFPHMREVYAKYKDKGVQFLNVSIDKNKNDWLTVVEKENNPWPQLLDDKDVSQKLFGVSSIPTTYLIDTEGKIIAKEIGFSLSGTGKIENQLKLLFGF